MTHDCRMGNLAVKEDDNGKMWIYHIKSILKFEERVDYCPICGKQAINSRMREYESLGLLKERSIDDPIQSYLNNLKKLEFDLNNNINVIKTFMISQNTQNECFIHRDIDNSSRLSDHEMRIKELEKRIPIDKKIPGV